MVQLEEQLRDKFHNALEDGVIINCAYDDDIWNLYDERAIRKLNFKLDSIPVGGIDYNLYRTALKCAVIENVYHISFASIAAGVRTVKRIMGATQGLKDLESLTKPEHAWILLKVPTSVVIPFFIYCGYKEDEISEMVINWDGTKDASRRYMAEFYHYFLFEDILFKAWENMTKEERIKYAPLYFYWKIGNIIPQRPEEFSIAPIDSLATNALGYTMLLRRSRGKLQKQSAGHKRERDFYVSEFPIIGDIADLILWYLEETKDVKRNYPDCLFVFFSEKGTVINNNSSNFGKLLNRFYKEYFRDYVVLTKNEYHQRIWFGDKQEEKALIPGEVVKIELGDIRVISMINMVRNGCNPTMIRRFTGHETIAMDDWYSGNISSYLKCQALREIKKEKMDTVDTEIMRSRKEFLFSDSTGVEVEGGTCYSDNFKMGKVKDCVKVNMVCHICTYCKSKSDETNKTEREQKEVRMGKKIESSLKRFESMLKIEDTAGNRACLETVAEQIRTEMEQLKNYYKKIYEMEM